MIMVKYMKISKCSHCNFKTNEKHNSCPICNNHMDYLIGNITYNPNLPQKLDMDNRDLKLYYYCNKCKNKGINKICLRCNHIGSLTIEYNEKQATINRIDSLYDVFTDNEVEYITQNLSDQEKNWIYHNFASSYRFFYKRDIPKTFVCFLLAIIMYSLCLSISTKYASTDLIIISYAANAFGNGILTIFMILGIWYLYDASSVEYESVPVTVALINGSTMFIYFLLSLFINLSFKVSFILGFIFILISIVIYLICFFINKKIKEGLL